MSAQKQSISKAKREELLERLSHLATEDGLPDTAQIHQVQELLLESEDEARA